MSRARYPRPQPRVAGGALEASLVNALAEGDGAFVALRPMYVDLASADRADHAAGLLLSLIVSCYTPAAGSGDGRVWARILYQGHLWVALSKDHIWHRTRLSEDQVARATQALRARGLVETCLRRFGKGPRTHYRLTEAFLTRRAEWLAAEAEARGYGAQEAAPPDAPRYPGKPDNEPLDFGKSRITSPSISGKAGERQPRFPGNPENFIRHIYSIRHTDSEAKDAGAPSLTAEPLADMPNAEGAWRAIVETAADLAGWQGRVLKAGALKVVEAEWARGEDGEPWLRVALGGTASPLWLGRVARYLEQTSDFSLDIWTKEPSPLPEA